MTEQTGTASQPLPVGTADRYRWQHRAAAMLGQLLDRGAKRGLPVVAWTVSPFGARLSGQCFADLAAERRAEFDGWCHELGDPDQFRETPEAGGIVRLYAQWDNVGKGLAGVTVALTATIVPDPDEEDGQ